MGVTFLCIYHHSTNSPWLVNVLCVARNVGSTKIKAKTPGRSRETGGIQKKRFVSPSLTTPPPLSRLRRPRTLTDTWAPPPAPASSTTAAAAAAAGRTQSPTTTTTTRTSRKPPRLPHPPTRERRRRAPEKSMMMKTKRRNPRVRRRNPPWLRRRRGAGGRPRSLLVSRKCARYSARGRGRCQYFLLFFGRRG